jgi:hypothetical protein
VTVQASCHCRSVRLTLPSKPEALVACDCSLCVKRGMLWAHYPEGDVVVDGYTEPYSWGDHNIGFCHCARCGCTTHWKCTRRGDGEMGVNARLIDGFCEQGGAETSRYFYDGERVGVRMLEGANG